MKIEQLIAIVALAGLPVMSQAATIVEGVDYADAPNVSIGPLGAGSHTISGTLTGNCLAAGPINCLFGVDPQDVLTITVAPSVHLIGIGFTFANDADPAVNFGMGFGYGSSAESFTFNSLLAGVYEVLGPTITPVGGDITLNLTADSALAAIDYTADWSVRLELAAVPLPHSLGFLVAGLLGLRVLRRRRVSA